MNFKDERDFTPPLVAEIEVPECTCAGGNSVRLEAAFHRSHQLDCPRHCDVCFVFEPCAAHRACNYIFYRANPIEGREPQF